MLKLDGSVGEGGGQILRTALGLSALTGRPFEIEKIRANRRKPGLMRQHLTAVGAAAEVCQARVEGDATGSTALCFVPGAVRPGEYSFAVGTAGSATLVLQTVLPPLLVASGASKVTVEGGTHNPLAPPFDFLERSFLPLVRRTGPASSASRKDILLAGVAGLVAGAMSMAVGEYVSVSAQRDAEQADIERETQELRGRLRAELEELALIYVNRGLDQELAMKVADQLSQHDRLGAHLRDELGIDQAFLARPMQAGWISAASFAAFGVVPILALLFAPAPMLIPAIAALSLVSLAALGAFGGHLGGAPLGRAALRVTIGGAMAMAVTAAIGRLFGVAMG